MSRTCGSLRKTKVWKDVIGIEYNMERKFCVLRKKVLSFGPNRTVEVRPNRTFGRSLLWPYCGIAVVPLFFLQKTCKLEINGIFRWVCTSLLKDLYSTKRGSQINVSITLLSCFVSSSPLCRSTYLNTNY